MNSVFCVRAEFGIYTQQFVSGGYVAIGWMANSNHSAIATREEHCPLYKTAHPDDTSNIVIGQLVGQIARFLLELKPDDYVITPAADTELLHCGRLAADRSYFFASGDDGCPYRHRRRVEWAPETLERSGLSVPFQNTIRSLLTVFAVSQRDEFLATIDSKDLKSAPKRSAYDPNRAVLERVLEPDDKAFEFLVGHGLVRA
ncbi:MAG: hypothetical protein L0Z55_05265 [Planctomycetes bacterium]|nr:hypothetical protein [Planctomycetota bacterium]